ncbi:MAG: ATP-binding protein [Solirubrobacteraceae bacterium]
MEHRVDRAGLEQTGQPLAGAPLRDLLVAHRAIGEVAVGPDDVTAVLDAEGRVVSASSNCRDLLGYESQELVGTYAHALLHPDDLRSLAPATQAFADGLTDHLHSIQRVHHKERGYTLIETTVRSTGTSTANRSAGAIVVARAPEGGAPPAQKPIVSFAPAAIGTAYAWVTAGSRRAVVASADPVFASLLGTTTACLVGRPLEELTDPDSPAVGQARLAALLDGSSATYQVARIMEASTAAVELTVSLLPLPDKPGHTAVIQARDVTRQREAEKAARDSLSELERSNRELEAFASVAAHDLAAPLRVVVGYAEMLAQGDEELNPQMAELLDKVASTSRRMQAQVDGLMMLARMEGEELTSGGYDIGALVQEALDSLKDEVERLRATIDVGQLPTAVCNATGIIQVFGNLLSNALKYGGERPWVSVEATRQSGAWQFTVADRGIGLPDRAEGQLFELFERGGTPGRVPGAGIGLAVCRRIVERHGGKIWCGPRPAGGAEFHFTLPDPTPDCSGSDETPDPAPDCSGSGETPDPAPDYPGSGETRS